MSVALTLNELAASTGTVVQGNPDKHIMAVVSIEEATESDISFIRDRKYAHYLDTSNAGALILVVSPSAVVADDVVLGEGVHIGANAVIAGGCSIGDNTVVGAGCIVGEGCQIGVDGLLHPNVTLAGDTCVGDRAILHSGVILGADGFGFVPQSSGWYKIPQIGRVVIGDDVEIGANTTVDRAAMGDTRIGHGVKLDNLIHIAHNVQIGDHTVIAACTGIAGSAKIGSRCQISGMCSIAGHLTVADDTTITATSFVINSITEPGVYSSGTTIDDHASWRRNAVRFRQLDQLSRRVNALEKQLAKQ